MKFASANKKHHPDLGEDASSVWTVCGVAMCRLFSQATYCSLLKFKKKKKEREVEGSIVRVGLRVSSPFSGFPLGTPHWMLVQTPLQWPQCDQKRQSY